MGESVISSAKLTRIGGRFSDGRTSNACRVTGMWLPRRKLKHPSGTRIARCMRTSCAIDADNNSTRNSCANAVGLLNQTVQDQ
jgi:hypothetical protein